MSDALERFVFPEPWLDLRDPGREEHRMQLVRRLRAETGEAHPSAARTIEAIAAFTRQDEVLYQLDAGEDFVIAHLTYAATVPDPFIRLRLFRSWAEAAAMVTEMADEW